MKNMLRTMQSKLVYKPVHLTIFKIQPQKVLQFSSGDQVFMTQISWSLQGLLENPGDFEYFTRFRLIIHQIIP